MRTLLAVLALLMAACTPASTPSPSDRAPAQRVPGEPDVSPALPPVEGDLFAQIPNVYQAVQPSIVAILAGRGEGSGVIWDADGIIVTNNHVVQGLDEVEIGLATGERIVGAVRATDPRTDLAVVEVDRADLPAAEFADGLPRVGELAIALGNPLGFENSVTAGIISGLNREIPGAVTQGEVALVDLIQTDAAISPGNSGGALVNARGQVIGVNIAYIPPTVGSVSIGFAVPAPTVVDVVTQLLETGEVEHPYLGIQLAELTPEIAAQFDLEAQRGVLVLAIEPGTPADQAGLREGDVIMSLNGQPVTTAGELLGQLRRNRPGDDVALGVLRDAEEVEVRAVLGERPSR